MNALADDARPSAAEPAAPPSQPRPLRPVFLEIGVYGAVVLLALAGVALVMLLPERALAVRLVYQGF